MTNNKKVTNMQKHIVTNFNNLPEGVFQTDPKILSQMDQAILDAIKFQMKVSKANNIMQKVNYGNIFRRVSAGITFTIIGFFLTSLTYYANVNLHLGMNFLTELFA